MSVRERRSVSPSDGNSLRCPSGAPSIRLVAVSVDDYEELSRFLGRFPGETNGPEFWLERFRYWWDTNPAFSELTPRGWALRTGGGIVGFLGSVPCVIQCLGKRTIAYSATTWNVLPQYRSHSLRLFRQLVPEAQHSILFNTSPNPDVVKVLRALKFDLLPRLATYSVIITDVPSFLDARMSVPRVFRPFLRLAAALASVIQDGRLRGLRRSDLAGVRQLSREDHCFDDLWERTKNLYQNTNVRCAEIVRWYCFGADPFRKTVFGYFRDQRLVGYAVCRRQDRLRQRWLECIDLWLVPDESEALPALVAAIRRYATQAGLNSAVFPHFNGSLRARLAALGLVERTEAQRIDYFSVAPEVQQAITAENSYFVIAQGDQGL